MGTMKLVDWVGILGSISILGAVVGLTATGRLATDPGASMSLIVNYRVAGAKISDGVYRMLVLPQPSWPPDRVRIRIEAPPGTLITEGSDQLEIGGSIAQFTGRPTRPISLWIRFD